MISNEMFGSDIIRVKINGYLKNNTENELITFNEKGIKNKEKISFVFDGVKYSIKINDNDILTYDTLIKLYEKNKNIKFGYGMQYAVLHTCNGGRNNND